MINLELYPDPKDKGSIRNFYSCGKIYEVGEAILRSEKIIKDHENLLAKNRIHLSCYQSLSQDSLNMIKELDAKIMSL